MNKTLTKLENAILEKIATAPQNKHLFIEKHLPFLSVGSRELTGVGMYVNFDDSSPSEILSEQLNEAEVFSSNHIVEIDTLKNGLGFALYAKDGKVDFIELFTYGSEPWDGSYNSLSFLEV